MKIIFPLFIALCFATVGLAQETHHEGTGNKKYQQLKNAFKADGAVINVLNHFSFIGVLGTGTCQTDIPSNNFIDINFSNWSISYKLSPRFSFGVGQLGSLDNNILSYTNAEGDIRLYDPLPEKEEYKDEREDDDVFGDNFIGHINFQVSEKLPFFIQAGVGYSNTTQSPIYTTMVGYNLKLYKKIGVLTGIRYNGAITDWSKADYSNLNIAPLGGFKAEVGVNWNF